MLRTLFSAIGIVFSALLLFCASFLGNVAAGIDRGTAAYEATTVEITRELSRTWKLSAIEPHYSAEARRELSPVFDADLQQLKLLGPLLYVEAIKVEPRWTEASAQAVSSPATLATRLAALITRAARVTFTGRFAGGVAEVSADLKREGGRLRLWRMRIDSRSPPPSPEQPERRVISHA